MRGSCCSQCHNKKVIKVLRVFCTRIQSSKIDEKILSLVLGRKKLVLFRGIESVTFFLVIQQQVATIDGYLSKSYTDLMHFYFLMITQFVDSKYLTCH